MLPTNAPLDIAWRASSARGFNGTMLSLLDDVAVAPVDAFLTAVDNVMNSNTLLLKVRLDEQVLRGNCATVLERFIHRLGLSRWLQHLSLIVDQGGVCADGTTIVVRRTRRDRLRAGRRRGRV